MVELNEKQILLVSGGEPVLITEEWKQDYFINTFITDTLAIACISTIYCLYDYGLTIGSAATGFGFGFVGGALYAMFKIIKVSTIETGTWLDL